MHAHQLSMGRSFGNEKRLLHWAGLRGIDAVLIGLRPDPVALAATVDEAERLLEPTSELGDSGEPVPVPTDPVSRSHRRSGHSAVGNANAQSIGRCSWITGFEHQTEVRHDGRRASVLPR